MSKLRTSNSTFNSHNMLDSNPQTPLVSTRGELADIRSKWFIDAVILINDKYGLSLREIGDRAGLSMTIMYACWNIQSPLHKFGRKPTEKTVSKISEKFQVPLPDYMEARKKKQATIFDATPKEKAKTNSDIMTKHIPKLFKVKEVAKLLGVSGATVNRIIVDGELKAKRVGRQYRIREADLIAYIES